MVRQTLKSLSLLILTLFMVGCSLFGSGETEGNGTDQSTVQSIEDTTTTTTDTSEDTSEDTAESSNDEESDEVSQELVAWMPRLDNVKHSYEGIGNEFAQFFWTPQFNKDNYYQVAENNGGTVVVSIYEYSDDEIIRTFSRPETYFRDNFTEIGSFPDQREEEVVLKAPIEVGTSWSGEESSYEITAVNHEVTVPAGTYQTIEVTNTFPDTIIKRYYAEDVGLVSEVSETEALTVESHLKNVESDVPEVLPLTVYVLDDQAEGLDRVQAELTLETNDPARVAMAELLRGEHPDFENITTFPEGTNINHLFLNNDQIVEVDLSSEFVTNMNAGSGVEQLYLNAVANTLAGYYGAQEVLLTIDGEPYESGHILLEPGETIPFNEDVINE